MMQLKVFVSSTCNDLVEVRDQLESFIRELGHQPILSDYSHVFFAPDQHTHAACVRAVPQADLLIVIITGRFGGEAVPDALAHVDMAALESASKSIAILSSGKISITQAEVFKAIESKIPVYTFVESQVYSNHFLYQENRSNPAADTIIYPSIDKQKYAPYIFEFVNFMRLQHVGNSFKVYSTFKDIKEHLLIQWSMLFQEKLKVARDELLKESKSRPYSNEGLRLLIEKAAQSKDPAARLAVINYSELMMVVMALRQANPRLDVITFSGTYKELLDAAGVKAVERHGGDLSEDSILVLEDARIKVNVPHELFGKQDDTILEFQRFPAETKQAVLEIIEAAAAVPGDGA